MFPRRRTTWMCKSAMMLAHMLVLCPSEAIHLLNEMARRWHGRVSIYHLLERMDQNPIASCWIRCGEKSLPSKPLQSWVQCMCTITIIDLYGSAWYDQWLLPLWWRKAMLTFKNHNYFSNCGGSLELCYKKLQFRNSKSIFISFPSPFVVLFDLSSL